MVYPVWGFQEGEPEFTGVYDLAVDYATSSVCACLEIVEKKDRRHLVVSEYYWDDREGGPRTPGEHADEIKLMVQARGYVPRFLVVGPSAAALMA